MAGELQGSFSTGQTCYFLVRTRNAQIWNSVTSTFVTYSTAAYSGYVIAGTEQGAHSAYYVGNFPTQAPAGAYGAVMKQQVSTDPAETDPTIDVGNVEWNGTNIAQLSDTLISGAALTTPSILPRGWMVLDYPIYLKSSADHISPFTSGILSGQISRDGGLWGALQSGAFTEVGYGVYTTTLTSGDLLANTVTLRFTGIGVSGGAADQLIQSFILQRTSGY